MVPQRRRAIGVIVEIGIEIVGRRTPHAARADQAGRQDTTDITLGNQVADVMEEWFRDGAVDGFNLLPPYFPGAFDDFVDLVIPELQRRDLFRKEVKPRLEKYSEIGKYNQDI